MQPDDRDRPSQARRWWFVFSAENTMPAWGILTKHRPGFDHVACFTEISDRQVMVIHPRPGVVEYAFAPVWPYLLVKEHLGLGHRVVVANITPDVHSLLPRGLLYTTCATHVAYSVGFSFRGLTPWQLHKALTRRGGVEIHDRR